MNTESTKAPTVFLSLSLLFQWLFQVTVHNCYIHFDKMDLP